jgi:hypothetical protein
MEMIKAHRRTMLKWLAALTPLSLMPRALAASTDDIKHILPTVTDTVFSISVSVEKPRLQLQLLIDGKAVKGQQKDRRGRFWSFFADDLKPDNTYELQLSDEAGDLGQSWPLKTFPDRNSDPKSFKLMAFTCAGGGDGFGIPSLQFFKPHAFRQRLFEAGLAKNPDAVIAIGDHIYWDLGGKEQPSVLKRAKWLKYLTRWKNYGSFNRDEPVLGTNNEDVLVRIGDEQISNLYGTRFKSTPVYFVSDDHDYFENDDATPDIVTFPPDNFSREAHQVVADLYYPPLPDAPVPAWNRAFGTLTYGRLFEASIFDCAGYLTVGDDARLIPNVAEEWLIHRLKQSPAKHYAMVPSHPFGWTAGKWREWYPDVVAPEGFTGVVLNELFAESPGKMTTKAQKYFWQKGWWNQHQRLLDALVKHRQGSRMIFSGDIHAQGVVSIRESGKLILEEPVKSFLVGPVSSSDATWPSAARGCAAAEPEWLKTDELINTREVNGFTIFEFEESFARAQLFDCGGYDRSKDEDGRVQREVVVEI